MNSTVKKKITWTFSLFPVFFFFAEKTTDKKKKENKNTGKQVENYTTSLRHHTSEDFNLTASLLYYLVGHILTYHWQDCRQQRRGAFPRHQTWTVWQTSQVWWWSIALCHSLCQPHTPPPHWQPGWEHGGCWKYQGQANY